MTVRMGQDAVDYALHNDLKGFKSLCLKRTRLVFGVAAKYATAHDAWANAKRRHFTTDPMKIPAGVPVFLGDNHVAVSLGDGMMSTTNDGLGGDVEVVPIESWHKTHPLKGWSEDLNGVTVYVPPAPKPKPAPKPAATYPSKAGTALLQSGSKGATVGKLQAGLRRTFPAYRSKVAVKTGQLVAVDNVYGPQTAAWVKLFQQRTGLPATGKVDATTKGKLAKFGVAL